MGIMYNKYVDSRRKVDNAEFAEYIFGTYILPVEMLLATVELCFLYMWRAYLLANIYEALDGIERI